MAVFVSNLIKILQDYEKELGSGVLIQVRDEDGKYDSIHEVSVHKTIHLGRISDKIILRIG